MSKRQDLRTEVEKRIGEPLTDARFLWLCEEILGDPDTHAFGDEFERMELARLQETAGDMAAEYARARRHGVLQESATAPAAVEIEPPEWWLKESRLILGSIRDEQADVLDWFGLREPLPLAELQAFIREQAALERNEGDPGRLPYPVPSRRDPATLYSEEQLIFRGVSTCDLLERAGRDPERPLSLSVTEETLDRLQAASTWAQPRTQRLWRLLELARRMRDRTGFGVDQMVGFLLCDLRGSRPWINIQPGCAFGPGYERWSFKIAVGTPEVTPDTLAGVYGHFLEDYGFRQPTRRIGRDSRAVLYAWVGEERAADPRIRFPALHERWQKAVESGALPGAVGYKSFQTMRSAYNQKNRELRAKAGAGGQEG